MAYTSRELAIIIGCSVGGGAFLLFAIIVIIAICINRRRNCEIRRKKLTEDTTLPRNRDSNGSNSSSSNNNNKDNMYIANPQQKLYGVGAIDNSYLPSHANVNILRHSIASSGKDISPCSSLVFPSAARYGIGRPSGMATYLPPGGAPPAAGVNGSSGGVGGGGLQGGAGSLLQSKLDSRVGNSSSAQQLGNYSAGVHSKPVFDARRGGAGGRNDYDDQISEHSFEGDDVGRRAGRHGQPSDGNQYVARAVVGESSRLQGRDINGGGSHGLPRIYCDYGSQMDLIPSAVPMNRDDVQNRINSRQQPQQQQQHLISSYLHDDKQPKKDNKFADVALDRPRAENVYVIQTKAQQQQQQLQQQRQQQRLFADAARQSIFPPSIDAGDEKFESCLRSALPASNGISGTDRRSIFPSQMSVDHPQQQQQQQQQQNWYGGVVDGGRGFSRQVVQAVIEPRPPAASDDRTSRSVLAAKMSAPPDEKQAVGDMFKFLDDFDD